MIRIDGQHLTTAQIATAADGPLTVEVSGRPWTGCCARTSRRVLAGRLRPIYGLTTGVGANRSIDVEPDTAGAQGLLRSHATSAGEPRSADRVRAMLLIRLNQLCAGGAGLRPAVVRALAEMINADALPVIREFVGIGTAELSALASTALALQDRSPAGDRLVFGPHDALPFISSNAAALSDAALAAQRLGTGARAALAVAALSFAAVRRQRRGLRRAGRAGHPDARGADRLPGDARPGRRAGAGPDPGPVRAARAAAGARHAAGRAHRADRRPSTPSPTRPRRTRRSWPTARSPTTAASMPATWRWPATPPRSPRCSPASCR